MLVKPSHPKRALSSQKIHLLAQGELAQKSFNINKIFLSHSFSMLNKQL